MITEVKLEDLERKYKEIVFGLRMDAAKGGNWRKNTPQEEIDILKILYDDYLTDNWTNLLDAATVGDQEDGKFKVNHAAFIIRGVIQGFILLEDVYKYKEYIDVFNRNKNQFSEKDLGQYKDQGDYSYFKKMAVDIKRQEDNDPTSKKGIEKAERLKKLLVKQANGYSLYKIPQQDEMGGKIDAYYNASCELGSGTEWCTATGNTKSYFNQYTESGPLYIFTPTDGGREKYQYSPSQGQFMDEDDNRVMSGNPIFKKLAPLFEFIDEDHEGGIDTSLKMTMRWDPNDVKDDFTYYFNTDIDDTAQFLYEDFLEDYLTEAGDGNWDNVKLIQTFFQREQLDPYNVNNWLKILLKDPKTFNQLTGGGRDVLGNIHLILHEGLQRLRISDDGVAYQDSKPYLEVFYEYVIKEAINHLLSGNTIKFEYEGDLTNILPKDF